MLKLIALTAALSLGCNQEYDHEAGSAGPEEYGTAKLAWMLFGNTAVDDDVPITINWGGGFMVMRYWASIEVTEPGTGLYITASCPDQNGGTQYGDGGIVDGSSLSAVVGEFIFFKDINQDCTFLIDDLFVTTSPTFSYELDVGNPS